MFFKIVKKFDTVKAAYLFTLCIMLISSSLTWVTVTHFEGCIQLHQIMLSLIIPIIIFPMPAKSFFDILLKLEKAEKDLQEKNIELEKSIKEIRVLEGLFPICSSCKQIRDDEGKWNQIESYIAKKSNATFSHSICPDCFTKLYPDLNNHSKN